MKLIELESAINTACDAVEHFPSEWEEIKAEMRKLPVVEERKHGHWFDPEDDDGCTAWHCSVCDYVVKTIGFYPNYNYCPCCGARMDEEVRK